MSNPPPQPPPAPPPEGGTPPPIRKAPEKRPRQAGPPGQNRQQPGGVPPSHFNQVPSDGRYLQGGPVYMEPYAYYPQSGGYYPVGGNPPPVYYQRHPQREGRLPVRDVEEYREFFQPWLTAVSTVNTFASILDTTVQTVQSSCYAFVSVANQVGQLRGSMQKLLSTLALVRHLRWLFAKALYLTGVKNVDPATKEAWNPPTIAGNSLYYYAIVFMAPYIILKLLKAITKRLGVSQKLATKEGDCVSGQAADDCTVTPANEPSQDDQAVQRAAEQQQQTDDKEQLLASKGSQNGHIPPTTIQPSVNYAAACAPEKRINAWDGGMKLGDPENGWYAPDAGVA